MKTQILHLEPYDDPHSIKDKINWGQGERIILVWPVRTQLLNHKLDLLLIKRHTQGLGAKLALVTKNHNIRQFASELDIPVFRSLRLANSLPWEYTIKETSTKKFTKVNKKRLADLRQATQPLKKSSWQNHPSMRVFSLLVGIIASLSIIAFFLPRAEIHISPITVPQTLSIPISASPEITNFNLSGAVSAQSVSIIVEGRDQMRPSGEISIPQQPATGEVVITNLTNQPIAIPKGTVVHTLDAVPVHFATTVDGEVPAQVGTIITILVKALNPGVSGNLPSNSLVAFEGNLGLYLSVNNPEPTTGGSDHLNSAPAAEDYDFLSSRLLAALWETALKEIEDNLASGDIILDKSPRIVSILEENFTPREPQPTSELSLLLRVEFELLVVSWQTLNHMINATLDATIPQKFTALPDTLTITDMTDPEFQENNTVTWEVLAQREMYTIGNVREIIRAVLGIEASKAPDILNDMLALNSLPEIQITPSWWPWLPFLEMQVKVIEK